jgi:long-chain fatty acid transport protein
MKKSILFAASLLLMAKSAMAGGLMTNTNYHIAFDRMFARGATFDIDAIYSNPAGLAWGHEGWQLSLNFQKPWQNRDIETTIPGILGQGYYYEYNGKASAPIVPAFFASYKKDRWTVSSMIGIVGSGGFVKYDDGVPMFNVPMTALLAMKGIMPGQYTLDTQMKGKQYIYGGQLNFTYKITEFLAAAVGMRANYYDGYNRGHVVAAMGNAKLINLQLDCLQKGWGFAPIVSLDFHQGPLTLGARYEFRTKINTENDTKELTAEIAGMTLEQTAAALGSKVAAYQDGVKTRYDMPALLTVAAGYEITPQLRAAIEYHFFDDKNAKMAGDRQKELKGGTNEFLLGVEYDINDKFTMSCGGQRTDYGLSDNYQQNTSFACDSYSFGLGGAWNINDKMRLNVSYFKTIYSDYTKEQANYLGTGFMGKDVYSRTNDVIGIGIDYKF